MNRFLLLTALVLSVSVSAADAPWSLIGKPMPGGIVIGKLERAGDLSLNDIKLVVDEGGNFVFGFGRDATGTATLRWSGAGQADDYVWTFELPQRAYHTQAIDGLPPSKVTPPSAVLERISREAAEVAKARAAVARRADFNVDWIWPTSGLITGVYGSQRILNGVPSRPHYGIDLAGPVGTPIVAPAGGIVTMAAPDLYYSGGTVIIDHGHGLSSTLLHLESVDVTVGQRVEQGDRIGAMGATGRATGSHLDWRMNWRGARVDPQTLQLPDL